MLYALRRHPFPVEAHFAHCLVLTYAYPAEWLESLLPRGLQLETYGDDRRMGFLAIAMVQTKALRPAGWPHWIGRDFFLSGYRVFATFRTPGGRRLRGLRILRSDTDHRTMVHAGNLLTHYNYRLARVSLAEDHDRLSIDIATPGAEADLSVVADLSDGAAPLPPGSPFKCPREARRFAGPLPYTFDYEPETESIIAIKATRRRWRPRPVRVDVKRNTFVDSGPMGPMRPTLASAFYACDIAYRWERGARYRIWNESGCAT